MRRCIWILILTIWILLSSKEKVSAIVNLISPPNGAVLDSWIVDFVWENTDDTQEYIYRLEYSDDKNFSCILAHNNIFNTYYHWGLRNHVVYAWRVKYSPKSTFDGKYIYSSRPFILGTNISIPEDILNEFLVEKEDDVLEGEEIIVEEPVPEVEDSLPFLEKSNISEPHEENNYVPKRTDNVVGNLEEFNWNTTGSTKGDILGEQQKVYVCRFKYFKKSKNSTVIDCSLPEISLSAEYYYKFSNLYSILIDGFVNSDVLVVIDQYDCRFDILDPSTWFSCKEEYVGSDSYNINANIYWNIYQGEKGIRILSYSQEGKNFSMLAGHVANPENLMLEKRYRIIDGRYNIDHSEPRVYHLNLLDYDTLTNSSTKPFSFPFKKAIGVTQWYGYTTYQSPHTGIDFGAYREDVLATGDGVIVSRGWDSYYGDCLSGGNYIKIKHDNGMYTVYFHLEEIFVNTGDRVNKEDLLARSGNSGAWNCQKLAYHLHLENRTTSSMNSHVNPVSYINADWSSIPTLEYARYPGRLSGENPHPGR